MTDQILILATFAASWALLAVGHNLADHVTGQNDHQALNKGAPSAAAVEAGASRHQGWGANLAHVASYHLTLVVVGLLGWLVLPLHWSLLGVVAALSWSAVTHAFLDRRWPVRWLLEHIGSRGFANMAGGGMNGMYLSDQALHGVALGAAAVMLAVL